MLSTEVRQVRCTSCGYLAPGNVTWAFKGLCPRCLAPLPTSADGEGDVPSALGPSMEDLQAVVSGWVDAFNARDLDGMLARMSPRVEFHPIRLTGVDGAYRGHSGVESWFRRVVADMQPHTLELREFRDAGVNRVIALGNLRLDGDSEPVPFWALDRFSDGLIVAAHHYVTDADILEDGRIFGL